MTDSYFYARNHENFYINDINYLASCYGLQKWGDPFYWHMYKYALAVPAIPELAFNVANIIKSIYGKNKKRLFWIWTTLCGGGVVGTTDRIRLRSDRKRRRASSIANFSIISKPTKDLRYHADHRLPK